MSKKNVAVIGDALLAKAEALNQAEVMQLRFDPKAAKRGILRGLDWVEPHRELIEQKYAGFDLPALELLPELCDRASAAQREHGKVSSVRDVEGRELIRAAMEWRRKLMPLADTLAANKKVSAEAVAHIHSGRGTHDNVNDVLALVDLLAPHSALVTAACGVEALAEAKATASAASERLGKATRNERAMRSTGDMRDRFGTLVWRGHERLRLLIAAMSSIKEADSIVDSLASRGRKTKTSVDDSNVSQPEPVL